MIEATGVSVTVDGAALLAPTAVRVDRGEAVAVRGANGSGKTTLLRVIAGQQEPTSGTVTVAGERVDDRSRTFRQHVAGALGPPPFARDLTLHEQLTLIATTWGRSVAQAESAADACGELLGLSRLRDRFPHELSSGQRQLAGLATAFVRPFEVLILDEPEQRLDEDHLGTVVDALSQARRRGATVLVATHNDRIAAETTDRAIVLAAA